MSSNSTIRAGFEPIPGYVLRQRLGAGGYGEVWSADAPGGLKKAIKLVYGSLDEERATSELRSLQRIRLVHHPLLLSLERIEIVNGQLIIVTELAESSLTDCFHAARRKQMQGIPREQLLELLRDAGDALDFLSQKHDLQHLDVKPGNLLLMADRIKLADFGLIKDLHGPNVSIVSGLTPTHAAPELFDGRPDRLSDLYSLAIVYQEMLTGKLPFDGRTAGELARQHLHQAPNLEPLPPADRRVVARALAKHPLDRHTSCRAFIEELRNSGAHEKYAAKSRVNEAAEIYSTSEEFKESSTCTSPALLGGLSVMPPLLTADSAEGWHAPLCLFIGIGGVGCQALTNLRYVLERKVDIRRSVGDHQWLAIDTDFEMLSQVSSSHQPGGIEYRNTLHIQLRRPQDYRNRSEDRLSSISRRWLYNIPRSQKTEGVRPLGMLAFADHLEEVERRLHSQLKQLLETRKTLEGDECQPIRVYVCTSLHGGTGSAIAADLGRMTRRVLSHLNCSDYFISALYSIATTTGDGGGLAAASALAALCELDAQMDSARFIPMIGPQSTNNASAKPFDWATLIDGGIYGSSEDANRTVDALAQSLWVDSHTLVGPTLDSARHHQGQSYGGAHRRWLRAARTSLVKLGLELQPSQIARFCCTQAIDRWQQCLTETSNLTNTTELEPQGVGWSNSQTMAIIEHLSSECLRCLGFVSPEEVQPNGNPPSNPWRNRTAQNAETIRWQIERDVRAYRNWLSEQIRPSYISWNMLQRIVLRVVERMLELAAQSDEKLALLAADDKDALGKLSRSEIHAMRLYIEQFASKLVQQLQVAQPQIDLFANTMNTWLRSLSAERTMRNGEASCDLTDAQIPAGWRHFLQRVNTILDSTLHRFVIGRCFHPISSECPSQETTAGLLSLEHLLRLSDELVVRIMREAGIEPIVAVANGAESMSRSLVLQEVDAMIPAAATRGGRLHRLLAITPAQKNDLSDRLEQIGMHQSCTMVPAQYGEDPVAVCDANDLNLSGLITLFWRPTSETFRLAERLHSRSDVAWPVIEELLANQECEPVA